MIAYDINDDDLGIYNENTVICYTSVQRRKCWVTDISNEVLIGRQCEYAVRPNPIGNKKSNGRQ